MRRTKGEAELMEKIQKLLRSGIDFEIIKRKLQCSMRSILYAKILIDRTETRGRRLKVTEDQAYCILKKMGSKPMIYEDIKAIVDSYSPSNKSTKTKSNNQNSKDKSKAEKFCNFLCTRLNEFQSSKVFDRLTLKILELVNNTEDDEIASNEQTDKPSSNEGDKRLTPLSSRIRKRRCPVEVRSYNEPVENVFHDNINHSTSTNKESVDESESRCLVMNRFEILEFKSEPITDTQIGSTEINNGSNEFLPLINVDEEQINCAETSTRTSANFRKNFEISQYDPIVRLRKLTKDKVNELTTKKPRLTVRKDIFEKRRRKRLR